VDVVELTGAKAIAAGNAHTCAVVDAGVKCWGSNDEGQIGDGNKGYDKDVHKPTDVKDLGAVAQIELGSQAGCARLESGEIRCWGYNNYTAQLLGTGSEEEFVVPPAPVKGLADAVDVSVGYNLACAVRRTGAVACWGEGGRGQLGIGEREKQFGPNEVAADAKALSPAPAQPFAFPPAEGVAVHVVPHIAQGYDHVCGVTAEGRVLCFGDGGSGQLGVGSTQGLPSNLGRVVPGITDAIQVSAAMQRTCVLRANGQVACWGDLGYANTSLPMPIDGITDAVEVSVGGSAYGLVACVRHVDRTVSCWGQNNSGELGNDTREASETPVKIPGLEDAAQLAVSLSTVCVRRESGKVACWGSNYYGELGNDSEEGSYVPADVPRLSRVTDLTASTGNVCAVAGGQVQCWGSNGDGQIGNGKVDADNPVRKPTAAAGVRNAVRVSTGDTSCAVLRDGKVMCWGDNAFGQVGIADTETDEVTRARALDLQDPTVAGFGAYVMYGCGRLHCCGLHADGHVSCTGTTPINGGADFFGLNAVHSAFPVAAPGIQFPATTPAQ
jgi:alpha-tubulin suppressor-like RCC1 family protein